MPSELLGTLVAGKAVRRVVRRALRLLRQVALVLAAAYLVLVAAGVLVTSELRAQLLGVYDVAAALLPEALRGRYVFSVATGGAFRGDFAIAAIVLVVVAWACGRVRRLV